MYQNKIAKLVEGSTVTVALVNEEGVGEVKTLQSIANDLLSAETRITNIQAVVAQIEALGLELPEIA